MHRFVFRWLIISLVVSIVLYTMSSSRTDWGMLIGASLFLGLMHALVRPLTLRLSQTGLVVTTVLVVAAINALFFGALGSVIPPYQFPTPALAMAGAAIVFVVSWPLNFFFRSSDGHVHAVTHHEKVES